MKDAQAAHKQCRKLSRTLHALLADVNDHASENDLYPILAYYLAKSTESFDAALLLLRQGYINDSAVLIRTIHECFVAIWWVTHGDVPKKVERFKLYGLLEAGEIASRPLPYTPGLIAKARKLHTRRSGRLNDSWTGRNFRALVDEVTATLPAGATINQEYLSNYRVASKLVHSTPAASLLYVLEKRFHAGPRPTPPPFMKAWTITGWALTYMARVGFTVADQLSESHNSFDKHTERIYRIFKDYVDGPPTT
jgi:hypothetical protein